MFLFFYFPQVKSAFTPFNFFHSSSFYDDTAPFSLIYSQKKSNYPIYALNSPSYALNPEFMRQVYFYASLSHFYASQQTHPKQQEKPV